jgi:signal transduction histidine kinase/DNA-binding response OmpR family regulator
MGGSSASVLVVDDEAAIADLLRGLLVSRGHAVMTAGTLAEARRHADEQVFDLILLDLELPDGPGEAFLKELRARPDPPEVLIITGHATLETAIEAVEAGAAGYVTKPFDLDALEARIDELLERRRVAAEAAREHGALVERLRETEAMLAVASTVSSTLDLREALRRICRALAQLIGADTASVYLLNADTETLQPFAGYRVPKEYLATLAATPLSLKDQGFYLSLWSRREPVWSDDVGADPRFGHELFRRLPHQSGLLLPLVLDDAVAGAVYFAWWHTRRVFGARELTLLEHVCGQLAALLKNARGWEQAQRDRERLQAINEVGRRLASVYDTDDVLSLIVHEAERLLGGAAAGIRLIEDDRLVVRARTAAAAPVMARADVSMVEGLSGHVVAAAAPLMVSDLSADTRFDSIHTADALALGFTGYLGVPLRVADRVIGCFSAFLRDHRTVGADDEALLTALADQAALALEKAHLLEISETRRAQLARVFDSISDGILLLDRAGVVLTSNRRAGELLGFDATAAGGAHLTDVLAGPIRDSAGAAALWDALWRLFETPADGASEDLDLPALGRTVSWTAQTIRDQTGAVNGLTLTLRDVTHERHVSRLKADFVSFVTHQLRTPLSGINWLLELAAEIPDLDVEASGYIADARGASARLTGLVNDLLDVSRLEGGKITLQCAPTDLEALTREVLVDVATLLRDKGHDLTVEAVPGLTIPADPQLIRQVFLNLTSNAVKYTPAGGRIAIRLTREAETVCWSVQDNGIGVPRANQARLFEKFYRADNVVSIETEGTGLGLCLARLIVERSGGQLTCESEEGRGSTFFVRLPLGGSE